MYALVELKNNGIQLVKCFRDEPSACDLLKINYLDSLTSKQLKFLAENGELRVDHFQQYKIEFLNAVEESQDIPKVVDDAN